MSKQQKMAPIVPTAPVYQKIGDEALFQVRMYLNEREAMSPLNRLGAGQYYGHDPDPDEAMMYFASPDVNPHGSAELEERHPYLATMH